MPMVIKAERRSCFEQAIRRKDAAPMLEAGLGAVPAPVTPCREGPRLYICGLLSLLIVASG